MRASARSVLSVLRVALAIMACLAMPAWVRADTIYFQPASSALGGNASQNAPDAFGSLYTAFDDFTLSDAALVTGVSWQGSYSDPVHGTVAEFTIAFWSNDGGLPGQLLQTQSIAGNAGERFVTSDDTFAAYLYGAALSGGFLAAANTTYWLSIQPTVDFPPQWFWRDGTGGNGVSASIIRSVSDNPILHSGDSTFSLEATPVPEPSSLVLLGTGMVVLIRTARRTRRSPAAGC